jgi:beta-galactosidase
MAKTYTFKGYQNDQLVITKKVGPSKKFDLQVEANKTVLENKETYDATRIVVRHIDENGSLMQYSNRVIKIETEGPIRVLGDSAQSLLGGQLSLFVFSKNKPGKSRIKISMDNIVKEINIEVK